MIGLADDDERVKGLKDSISSAKTFIFNLMFLGVYKDESPEFKYSFYLDFVLVIIGLFIEN